MAVKKSVRPKKKDRKNIEFGVAHISSTFNNTIVTLTDKNGNAPVSYTHLTLPTICSV